MQRGRKRSRTRAFTLVELLVVIAIIALLMSILMPALSRVRKQAKLVMCQTNLKQWGACFTMYAGDHNGSFMKGWTQQILTPEPHKDVWMEALRPYYQDRNLCLCPVAPKPGTEIGLGAYGGWGTFVGWGVFDDSYIYVTPGDYGSYGENGFINNPPPEVKFIHDGMPVKNQWRRIDVKGAGNIPMLLDCQWTGGWPLHVDSPPEYDGQPWAMTYWSDQMIRFCINRHNGFVNSVFLDSTVRKVGLKELWKLKWHRSFDLTYPPPTWPDWMKDFKDF